MPLFSSVSFVSLPTAVQCPMMSIIQLKAQASDLYRYKQTNNYTNKPNGVVFKARVDDKCRVYST